jgi:hypothetical protein
LGTESFAAAQLFPALDSIERAADVMLVQLIVEDQRRSAPWLVDVPLFGAVTRSRGIITIAGHPIAGHPIGAYPVSPTPDTNLMIGLADLERQAQKVESTAMRAVFVERAQSLLLLACERQIMRGRHEAGLWFSDRARQVAFRIFANPDTDTVADINAELGGRELVKALPAGITVIHQDLHDNQLATWVIRDGRVQFTATPVLRATLEADIDKFREEIRQHRPESVDGAKRLYEALLGPVRELIAGAQLLVYSRSPALQGVPFSALHDGQSFSSSGSPWR